MANIFEMLEESAKHPMHVHAKYEGGKHFKVVSVGKRVSHVKVGDRVTSSDLDDLSEAGHKIKELREEVEQIDEISRKTLASYVGKAAADQTSRAYIMGATGEDKHTRHKAPTKAEKKWDENAERKLRNRSNYISKAADKLAKEEVELIDEISKKTLSSYVKKASGQMLDAAYDMKKQAVMRGLHMQNKDYEKKYDPKLAKKAATTVGKRYGGILKATDNLAKEEVEQITVGKQYESLVVEQYDPKNPDWEMQKNTSHSVAKMHMHDIMRKAGITSHHGQHEDLHGGMTTYFVHKKHVDNLHKAIQDHGLVLNPKRKAWGTHYSGADHMYYGGADHPQGASARGVPFEISVGHKPTEHTRHGNLYAVKAAADPELFKE